MDFNQFFIGFSRFVPGLRTVTCTCRQNGCGFVIDHVYSGASMLSSQERQELYCNANASKHDSTDALEWTTFIDFRVPNPATVATKTICTLGPASTSKEMVDRLIRAGMSAIRLNSAHGSHEHFDKVIRIVREVALERGVICPIILDTKGPEIRIGKVIYDEGVDIRSGSMVDVVSNVGLEPREAVTTSQRLVINYDKLGKSVKEGDVVLLDNGRIALSVVRVPSESSALCKVISGGLLKSNKGVNLPGCYVDLPHVTAKDEKDIAFAVSRQIEYIAHSFTRSREGIEQVRNLPGVRDSGLHIIAKIESQEGLDNFAEILDASDGIMVARGDLGVEIPLERVCSMQKRIIRDCNVRGKFVITATEMLESMISNPRPTRAEASDVANAVFDGTDCVMLSGETAVGQFPLESVQVMARICKEAELDVAEHGFISAGELPYVFRDILQSTDAGFEEDRQASASKVQPLGKIRPMILSIADEHREAFARAAVSTAKATAASMIIVFCKSPDNARFVAKHRPSVPILALSTSPKVCAQISLYRGVRALIVPTLDRDSIPFALAAAAKSRVIRPGSRVLLLSSGGDDLNTIETLTVTDKLLTPKEETKIIDYTPGSSMAGP